MALIINSDAAMRQLGRRLAALLRPADLIVLSGGLGSGKTTLTQGIGAGLGVEGPVVSPTFVIARVHGGGRLPLVHVDAYRLGGLAEVDDLDLDAALEESVTVVEWGAGLVEGLSDSRLVVTIERDIADPDEQQPSLSAGAERRLVTVEGVGARWAGIEAALEESSGG